MQFHNPFINKYIEFTAKNTESPTAFHVWAAVNGAGSILARNAWIRFGHGKMFANTYVIIVGPPGARKSSALSIMRKLITDNTSVRFGPSDTGGARQGLLAAMAQKSQSTDMSDEEEEEIDAIEAMLSGNLTGGINPTGVSLVDLDELMAQDIDPRRNNTLYISASEMTSFTGVKQFELINCLSELYDTDNYKYQLKDSKRVIRNPSMSFIAATTPKSLFLSMPDNAIEQGFISRTVLVYGAEKTQSLAWPVPPDEELQFALGQQLKNIDDSIEGEITLTPDAKEYAGKLYEYKVQISDDRFTSYKERRYTQLLKVAMSMCALRMSQEIVIQDVMDSHALLQHAEATMPDALGHYGLNPISIGKQRMMDYFREMEGKLVSDDDLYQMFSRDLNKTNYTAVVKMLLSIGFIRATWAKYPGSNNPVQAYLLAPNATEIATAKELVEMTTDEVADSHKRQQESDSVKKLLRG